VSVPLTSIILGTWVGFIGSLTVFLSNVVSFVLDGPVDLTHEELDIGLLCAGKEGL